MAESSPCPQAAATTVGPRRGPDPWLFGIELDNAPRPGANPFGPEMPVIPDLALPWPYHLPKWNAIDAYWWALLVRASYGNDGALMRVTAGFAGPVLRFDYRAPSAPAIQGRALIELTDSWLCVIPGTFSDLERNAYLLTHALEWLRADTAEGWTMNATFYDRGLSVFTDCVNWPFPPAKPLIAVGHSSGGAYGAVVAVGVVQVHAMPKSTLVTYGAPVWCTPSLQFRLIANKSPVVIEFVNAGDPVTLIPPPWSIVDLLRLQYPVGPRPDYIRAGAVLELQGGPGVIVNPAIENGNDRAWRAASGIIAGTVDATEHHSIVYSERCRLWALQFATDQNAFQQYDALLEIDVALDSAGL